MNSFIRPALAIAVALLVQPSAKAQTNTTTLTSLFIGGDPRSAVLSEAQLDILRKQLAIDINSLPTQTSSSPAPEIGKVLRRNSGPIYLQRAVPIGQGNLETYASVRYTDWNTLDGIDLSGDKLANRVPGFFGRPGVDSRVSLDLSTTTLSLGANYGLLPSTEIGIIVPVQRVCVEGVRNVAIEGGSTQTISAASCGTGIGDLEIRSKWGRFVGRQFAVAGSLAVALATGNPDELTGKGQTQSTVVAAVSKPIGLIQPHLNLGATLGGHGVQFSEVDIFGTPALVIGSVSPSRSFDYGAGINVVFNTSWTLSFEFVGRERRHGVEFMIADVLNGSSLETAPVPWQSFVVASAGAKRRFGNHFVVAANLDRQLSSGGLRASWMTAVGLTLLQSLP